MIVQIMEMASFHIMCSEHNGGKKITCFCISMHCVFKCTDIIGINNELKLGCKGKFVGVHGSIVDVFTIGCKRSNVKDL